MRVALLTTVVAIIVLTELMLTDVVIEVTSVLDEAVLVSVAVRARVIVLEDRWRLLDGFKLGFSASDSLTPDMSC